VFCRLKRADDGRSVWIFLQAMLDVFEYGQLLPWFTHNLRFFLRVLVALPSAVDLGSAQENEEYRQTVPSDKHAGYCKQKIVHG
jgi:hypothetical protein